MRDALIDEVRKFRDEYARQFNYDLHAMCGDLRREQSLGSSPVVSFATQPTAPRHKPLDGQADATKATATPFVSQPAS